ncbi:unnamed protein product, partial [Ixodes hexagonus]
MVWMGPVCLLIQYTTRSTKKLCKNLFTSESTEKLITDSGGDIDVLVASDDELHVIGPIREAFQKVFGRATVMGVSMLPSNMAPQPVGFAAGLQAAEDKITSLQQTGRV